MGCRMPFSTDTAWPQGLHTIFDICHQQHEPLENCYFGPYCKLLNYCFSDSFQYFVTPQSPPSDLTLCETVDFLIFFVIFDANHNPELIADLKDNGWAHKADFIIMWMTRFVVGMTQCLVTVLLFMGLELAQHVPLHLLQICCHRDH